MARDEWQLPTPSPCSVAVRSAWPSPGRSSCRPCPAARQHRTREQSGDGVAAKAAMLTGRRVVQLVDRLLGCQLSRAVHVRPSLHRSCSAAMHRSCARTRTCPHGTPTPNAAAMVHARPGTGASVTPTNQLGSVPYRGLPHPRSRIRTAPKFRFLHSRCCSRDSFLQHFH